VSDKTDAASIHVRLAEEADVSQIRDVYTASYLDFYPYKEFYDTQWLKRTIFGDDVLMLVAEASETQRILGTASVVLDIGAYSDLIGEFGRLVVHPDARRMGIGTLLMKKRIELIQDRLHLGLIEARVVHPFAQKIGLENQFVAVGFQPFKHYFSGKNESLALLVRYFGDALSLRKNNPRIIPEIGALAHLAFGNTGIPYDAIIDESSAPYPHINRFELKELTEAAHPLLLRIERGRVRNREVFGHMRLEYGFFKLRVGRASYLIASESQRLAGAIGFTLDHVEHTVRIFELIASSERAIWFLLSKLEQKAREEWGVESIQIDVSAYAPRMQRTLLELHFLPVAYIPAMVFHEVERLDIVRMVRLIKMPEMGAINVMPPVKAFSDCVMEQFQRRDIAPRIAQDASNIPLFKGMTEEQMLRLASACTVVDFVPGEEIFREHAESRAMYIVLEGEVGICFAEARHQIGRVGKGEPLGELSFFCASPHSATATAASAVTAASLNHQDLSELIRRRPDMSLILYKNLAAGLAEKLHRSNISLHDFLRESPE